MRQRLFLTSGAEDVYEWAKRFCVKNLIDRL